MENFFSRYKNPLVLMAILFVQVVALATQVKRPEGGKGSAASGGTRLIRLWTINAMSPFERAFVSTGRFFRQNFHNYIDLHNAQQQNRELQDEIGRLKLEQVRLRQDAEQAKRLQALLGFTQHYVGQLLPAQVIGTSGTEQSHLIQIDKGSRNGGVRVDMPVITPDGIVGKIKDVQTYTSTVLMINDRDSGAGVILQNSRLQGILRGSPVGELHVSDIMADEKIDEGEELVTSGGDRIYPKGLPVGTVSHVSPDRDNDPFLLIRVKPAADLNRLEEVLVVTRVAETVPQPTASGTNVRAADILSERLPSVPKVDETKKAAARKPGASPSPSPSPGVQTGSSNPSGTPAGSQETKKPPAASGTADVGKKSLSNAPASPSSTPSASPMKTPAAITSREQKGSVATNSAQPGASAGPSASPKKVPAATASGTGAAKPGNGPAPAAASNGAAKPAASPKKPKPQATPSASPTPSTTTTPEGAQQNPAASAERPPR
jgi:rod shape-determining protein MreC